MNKMLPYLLKKAQEGDDEAAECIKSMADDGDEDALDALSQLAGEDGNGASPNDPISKGQLDIFDLEDLDSLIKSLDAVDPVGEDADVDYRDALYTDEIQSVMDVDATGFVGDLVKGMADVNQDLAAQVGYAAAAADAGVAVTRDLCSLVKSLTAEVRGYRAEVTGLRAKAAELTAEVKARAGQGAGFQGAATATALSKSFGALGAGATGPRPGDLIKSLTAIADDATQADDRRGRAAKLASDLTLPDATTIASATQFLSATRN